MMLCPAIKMFANSFLPQHTLSVCLCIILNRKAKNDIRSLRKRDLSCLNPENICKNMLRTNASSL